MAKTSKVLTSELVKSSEGEIECLKHKGEFLACRREAGKSVKELLEYVFRMGEILTLVKKASVHGEYTPLVEEHYGISAREAQRLTQAHKRFAPLSKTARLRLCDESSSITDAFHRLKSQESSTSIPDQKNSEAVIDTDNPCPNCQSLYWITKGDGYICDNCKHPYGEPVGDPDEKGVDDDEELGDLEMKKGSARHEKEYKKARSAMGVVIRFLSRMKVTGAEEHTEALLKMIG